MHTEYLIDLFSEATVAAPNDNYVDLEKMILAREVENAIFQHPPSTVAFPPIVIGKQAVLAFACGIKQAAWAHIKTAVHFTITIETAKGRRQIFAGKLDPRNSLRDRQWQRHELSLSAYEGESVSLTLQTRAGWRRSTEYAWAGWANPRLIHELEKTEQPRRHPRHRHVFLITADAL